jgi:hypothetical protein
MSFNELERTFHSIPMISQECARKCGGTPPSYVRKFKLCVSHTQLTPWASKSDAVGQSFIGRVEDYIVFTTKERTRTAMKRRLEEEPCNSTLSTIVHRLGFRRARRPNSTPPPEIAPKEIDDIREYVKTLVTSASELPSEFELRNALIVLKRAKALMDEQNRTIHVTAQISYNNCSVGNGLLKCPKLVVLVRIPAHVAVAVASIGRMLEQLPVPVDCIYSCESNPLKTIFKRETSSTSADNESDQALFMTIAVSIPAEPAQ